MIASPPAETADGPDRHFRHGREAARAGLPVLGIRLGDGVVPPARGVHLVQPDDSVCTGIGQGTQQYAVDHAEDRRGGPDAEPERQDREDGKRPGAASKPHAVARVAEKVVEQRHSRALSACLPLASPDGATAGWACRRASAGTVQ